MTNLDSNENRINLEREKVIEKITKWLKEDGFTVEVSYDPKITDRLYFYALVKHSVNKCAVYIPRNRPDNILIETNFRFRPEDQTLFNRLQQADQNQFIFDLQLSFVQTGVRGATKYDKDNNLTVKVLKVIYFDALTKHLFLTYIHDIFQATYMAMVKFGQFRDSKWPEGADRPAEDYGGYFSVGQ